MGMRIKANLRRRRGGGGDTPREQTHLWILAKRTQVRSNLWWTTQARMSPEQTDALEHTHTRPAHLTDKFKSRQTHRGITVSIGACLNPTHSHIFSHTSARTHTHTDRADKYTVSSSIKRCPDTSVTLLNLFKQCNGR